MKNKINTVFLLIKFHILTNEWVCGLEGVVKWV